jgi:hypothetical protein
LSNRLLVFTDHQTSFYCSATAWKEGLGDPGSATLSQVNEYHHRLSLFGSIALLGSPNWSWNHLASLLESYSARHLTNAADTLDAFLGVMIHIQQLRPDAGILCGLPFLKSSGHMLHTTLIDSLEELVTAALTWQPAEDNFDTPVRQHIFPSWTWAGWRGKADFWIRSVRRVPRYQPFVRQVQLETSSGHIVTSSASHQSKTVDQSELDTVILIQFDAPMILADSLSIADEQLIDTGFDCSSIVEGHKLKVSGHPMIRNRHPDIHTLDKLIENVQHGIWSCFTLGVGRCSLGADDDEHYSQFVLVVCWEADHLTAERVGSFEICSDSRVDVGLGPLGEEGCMWRRVRLI